MRKLAMFNMFLLAAVLWFLILVALVSVCSAQTGGWVFSERSSSRPHGEYIKCWNTTLVEIKDGTVVMADTVSSTALGQVAIGKGFKTWSATSTDAPRLLGILIGNCPGGNECRIMTRGFMSTVKLDKTGITAFSVLKPSLTHAGRLTNYALAETVTAGSWWKPRVGIFQRYARTDSLLGYVWFDFRNIP